LQDRLCGGFSAGELVSVEAFKDKDDPDLVDEINRLGAEVKQIEGELAHRRTR
jgi:hypothetical protein